MSANTNSKAVETLDSVIQLFVKSASRIRFQAYLNVANFKKEYSRSIKELKNHEKLEYPVIGMAARPYVGDLDHSIQENTGWLIKYPLEGISAMNEEYVRWIKHNLNTQLRWLLVDQFESLESFIKDLYGALGYLDNSLWRGSDFGNVLISEIGNKDLEWYKQRVRSIAKHNCREIITQFERINHEVADWTGKKSTLNGTTLLFWIRAAEHFRHMIVHSHGESEQATFWQALTDATGHQLVGDASEIEVKRTAIKKFVIEEDSNYVIQLIDESALDDPTFHQLDYQYAALVQNIVDFSCLLYTLMLKRYNEVPYWRRNTVPEESLDPIPPSLVTDTDNSTSGASP